MKILFAIFLFLLVIVLFVFLDIVLGYVMAIYNHKCPYCGKRMKFKYRKYGKDGELESYNFFCPNCEAWDMVSSDKFIREWDNSFDCNKK